MILTVTPLRKAAKFIRGITFKPEDMCSPSEPGAVVCMRTKNIQADIDLSDLIAIPDAFVRRAEQNLVEGDLLISSANSWNLVGKACWVPNLSCRSTAGGFISILRCDRDLVFPRYFYHWVTSGQTQHDLRNCGRQTTNISNLDFDRALDLEIPLPYKNGKPDLEEQKRIAAILDKADAIRRKLQQSLRLSDDFLRSVFLDMFGDPEGQGWESTTVEELASQKKGSIRTGPFGSQLLHSEFVDEGIAVLGIDNAVRNKFAWGQPRFITEEKYEDLKRYTVHPGDVLITIMGTCGRCAVVPHDVPKAINTKHLCCITLDPKKCLPEFLHSYFLLHPMAKSYLGQAAKGAIMDGLNMGLIKSLPVPIVPIALQRAYIKIVKHRANVYNHLTTQAAESETLFSSLQQRAFRGEL